MSDEETDRRVKRLIAKLRSENSTKRWEAALALGEMGRDAAEAVPDLIEALKDEYLFVRSCVATALRNINDARAVPVFIELLTDDDAHMCLEAASALKDMDLSILPLLFKAGIRRPELRETLKEIIGEITKKGERPTGVRMIDAPPEGMRQLWHMGLGARLGKLVKA